MVDAQSGPSARLDSRADTAAGFGPAGGAFASRAGAASRTVAIRAGAVGTLTAGLRRRRDLAQKGRRGQELPVIIISIMAICARCKREQRSNQRSFEMTDRQSSYEPPVVVQGERVPAQMGRVPPSKLDSPRGAVV